MEYLEGETLAHGLEKGALPLEQALQYSYRSRTPPTRPIDTASSIAI